MDEQQRQQQKKNHKQKVIMDLRSNKAIQNKNCTKKNQKKKMKKISSKLCMQASKQVSNDRGSDLI